MKFGLKNGYVITIGAVFLFLSLLLAIYFITRGGIKSYTISAPGINAAHYFSNSINGKNYFLTSDLNGVGYISNKTVTMLDSAPPLPGELIEDVQWFAGEEKALVKMINDDSILGKFVGYEYIGDEYIFGLYDTNKGLTILPSYPQQVMVINNQLIGLLGSGIYEYNNGKWDENELLVDRKLFFQNGAKYFALSNDDSVVIYDERIKVINTINTNYKPTAVSIFDNKETFIVDDIGIGHYLNADGVEIKIIEGIVGKQLAFGGIIIYQTQKEVRYFNIYNKKNAELNIATDLIDPYLAYLLDNSVLVTNEKKDQIRTVELK